MDLLHGREAVRVPWIHVLAHRKHRYSVTCDRCPYHSTMFAMYEQAWAHACIHAMTVHHGAELESTRWPTTSIVPTGDDDTKGNSQDG